MNESRFYSEPVITFNPAEMYWGVVDRLTGQEIAQCRDPHWATAIVEALNYPRADDLPARVR